MSFWAIVSLMLGIYMMVRGMDIAIPQVQKWMYKEEEVNGRQIFIGSVVMIIGWFSAQSSGIFS